MKTPMQEMLEWVRETLPMDLETPRLITPRLIEHKIESMLEKEKEVMCEFAGEYVGSCLIDYPKIEVIFNQTFKTKE
jgi:hypothetical protein